MTDEKPPAINPDWSEIEPNERERFRRWFNRSYRDPATRLREVRPYILSAGRPSTMFAPSQREADKISEEFVGTMYSFAMGRKHEVRTLYSHGETEDGDGILWADDDGKLNLVPVQVKQVRNPVLSTRTLNDELATIAAKYPRPPTSSLWPRSKWTGSSPSKTWSFPK